MAYAERNKNRKKELKLEYEHSVLERIGFQCQCGCGIKIGDVPRRRFNWDHVDRSTKIDTISTMKGDRYSLQEFKDELDKCQLLLDVHHHAVTRAQNAGQIIDYRLPRLHRDWDMFPFEETTSAKMNALSEWQDPHSVEMYDRWIQCVPGDVDITYEEWRTFGWTRTMLEGIWYVQRDMAGKLLSGCRKTDGAQLEIHWLHGVRLRETKQSQLT
jgi:hypothetical protein